MAAEIANHYRLEDLDNASETKQLAKSDLELMNGYRTQFIRDRRTDGDGGNYKVIVVVFTDLPAARARSLFGEVLQHLAGPSYVEDGVLFGPFYEGNENTAIYNSRFRPFQSPVPFCS